jgi:hypothetical protein
MTAPSTLAESCPLCGGAFHASDRGCRPSCPLSSGCGMMCCPRCGYGFPQEGRGLAGVLRRALVRLGRRP